MSIEERKENRMLMAQAVLNNGKQGSGRLQNAAAAVLGGGSSGYKGGGPVTDERRNTLGANAQLPPSGYRGISMNGYARAGTGNGPSGSLNDAFGSAGYGSNSYNYGGGGGAMSGPKIATINVRVSLFLHSLYRTACEIN